MLSAIQRLLRSGIGQNRQKNPSSLAYSRVIPAAGALGAAAFLLLMAMVSLNFNLSRLRDSFNWVKNTDEALYQLASIEGNLMAAESAGQAYLLTGNNDYVTAFETAKRSVLRRLSILRTLVSDNSVQVERVDQLRGMMETRLWQSKQVIEFGPDRQDEALRIVRAAAAQHLTASIRTNLETLRQTERDLLRQQQQRADRDATSTTALAAATTIAALLSASLGLLLFQRERTRHRERELQSELIHVSRLNMMGQTASMLAHELNQPLTAATNYVAAIRGLVESFNEPHAGKILGLLQRAAAQTERAAQIVRRLRGFIARGEPETSIEPVGRLIDEAVALLGLKNERLAIACHVAPGLAPVRVDKVQVQQVLINLMRNAVEAMEHSNRCALDISAAADGNGMVRLSVRDWGPGLAEEVADSLFQPFVSTKRSGMGVGLSICRMIVERNGGRIWAEPNPEGGTIFSFTLPAAGA